MRGNVRGRVRLFTSSAVLLAVAVLLAAAATVATRTYPRTDRRFDTATNGLWVGHRWYTGREVRTGDRVPAVDVDRLVARLRASGIRFVYVHVGPIRADGSIDDSADALFDALRASYPEGQFLAWIGARVENVHLGREEWRQAAITQIRVLQAEGFDGVHFDFEPLRDGHAGYLELLAETRDALGPEWIISQATPRAALLGLSLGPLQRSFWSAGYYRATMEFADQTVLMAYDTNLPIDLAYVAFVRDQTRSLVRWACSAVEHEVLIGIPSYQDAPEYSDPHVENVTNALLGVRSALETFEDRPECFRGVAVYANWVTDEQEWSELDRVWSRPDRVDARDAAVRGAAAPQADPDA